MTPEQITEERSRRLKSAFIDQDFGGAKALLDDNAFGGVVEDKEAFLTSSAVAGWAGVTLGRRVNPAAPDWQGVKDGIARGFFKNQTASNVSDEDMFGMIAADYQAQDKVASTARMAAARGESWLGKFRELETKESGNMIPGRMANYIGLARAAHDEMAAKVAPYRSTIKTVAEMARNIDTAPDGMDWGAMASELIKVPKKDRPYVLEALSLQTPGESGSGDAETIKLAFMRGMERYLDNASSALETQAETGAGRFLRQSYGFDVEAVTPEQREQRFDFLDLRDDMRDIATGKLAPLNAVRVAGMNISGAVENVPMTIGSFVPYVGVAATISSFQRSTYNEIRRSNPTMSRDDANKIATYSAPIQAVTEIASDRFLFGKLPNLKRAFTQPIFSATGALSMFTTRAAIGTATEVSEEFIQGVTPLAVQYISKGLGADLPSTDWKGFFSDFADNVPELISTILPLAIVGAGTGQLSDFRAGRQMARSTDTLIAAQYSPESAARISELANAGKWSEAEDAMRTDWAKINAKGADVSQVKATAEQRIQAANRLKMLQKEQSNVAELTTSPEYTASVTRTPSGWQVTTGDGTIIPVESAEAARRIAVDLRQVGSQQEADALVNVIDGYYAAGKRVDTVLTGEDVKASETVGVVATRRDANNALLSQRQFGPQALETVRAEAEVAGIKSDTRKVFAHINGSNEAFPMRVADGAKAVTRILNLYRSQEESQPQVITFLHENIESSWRLGMANGTFSEQETRTAFSALLPAFEGIQTTDALELQFIDNVRQLAAGKGNDTMMRETVSEMVVRDVLGRDRDGRATGMKPGSISRAIEASVMGANTQEQVSALKSILAAIKAFTAYLKAVFSTVDAISTARDEGKLGEDWIGFVDKVLGIDEVKRDEGLAMNEAQAILEDSDMPFSISPAFSISVPTSDIDTIPEDLARAEADMKAGGKGWAAKVDLSQPVGVYRGEDGRLKLFDGHHRWLAARERGEPLQVRESVFGRAVPIGEAPVVAEMPDGAQLVGPATFSITAYHGTPHKVDKFTTAKIGTGEGAQAFGWGLYFAAAKKVAEQYRKELSRIVVPDDVAAKSDVHKALAEMVNEGMDIGVAADKLRKFPWDQVREARDEIAKLPRSGNLYTVELLPDADDFLDWDKPLSEQSEKVKAALASTGLFTPRDLNPPANFVPSPLFNSGRGAYDILKSNEESDEKASKLLASLGIAGMKYFDGNSRNIEFGTRNYVIFDESLVKILEENGQKVEGQSFSISPIRNLNELSDQVERQFKDDPVKALEVKSRMIRQFAKYADKWSNERWTPQGNKIRPISDKRTVKSLDKEQAMRQAQREVELVNEGIDKLTPETLMAYSEGVGVLEDDPLVDKMLNENGRLMSKATAAREGRNIKDQYDDLNWIPPQWYSNGRTIKTVVITRKDGSSESFPSAKVPAEVKAAIKSGEVKVKINKVTIPAVGGIMPDVMANNLGFDTASEMWAALESSIKSHRNAKEGYAKAESAVKAVEKAAFEQARKEAQAWRDEADAMQKEDWSPKESLVRDLITLEAIRAMFPQEIRDKIGGFVTLARKASESARLKVLQKQLERGQVLLEKHLKEQYNVSLLKMLDKAAPVGKPGEVKKSKFIVTVQDELDAISEIVGMDSDDVTESITTNEAAIISAQTPEAADVALTRLNLLELFGGILDLKRTSSQEMEVAHEYLAKLMKQGREARKIIDEARSAKVKEMVAMAKADAFKGQTGPETTQAARAKAAKESGRSMLRKFFGELSGFDAVLRDAFGPKSETARSFSERFTLNSNDFEDVQNERRTRFRDFARELYQTKLGAKINQKLIKLERIEKNSSVTYLKNREVKTHKFTESDAAKIVADPKAFGFTDKDAAAISEEIQAIQDSGGRRKVFTYDQIINDGDRVEIPLSQMDAVYISMALRQPGILEQQERHGYDQQTVDELDKYLTDEAKAWRRWMQTEYDAEYQRANEVYMRMFNARMPMIMFYAPLLKNHQGQQAILDPLNTGISSNSANPGSIKTRKGRTSSLRIESALTVFWAHFNQMEYWIANAEYLRDVQAVLLNPEVRESVVASHGEDGMATISAWIQLQMSRGVGKAALATAGNKIFRNVKTGLTMKALALSYTTALKTLPSVFYSLGETHMSKWPSALVSGMTHWNRLWKTNIIQRRLDIGGMPELRDLGSSAMPMSWMNQLIKYGSAPAMYADAVFTTFSAAMAYGVNYDEAIRQGASEDLAHEHAEERTALIVSRTAQPENWTQKSLLENDVGAFGSMFTLFMSDPRQKMALTGAALNQFRKGNVTGEEAARKFLAYWVIPGIMFQLANAIGRSLFKGDDDEWEVVDFATAALVGQLQGLVLLGSAAEMIFSTAIAAAAEKITGEEVKRKPFWNSSKNPLDQAAQDLIKSAENLNDTDKDVFEKTWEVIKSTGMLATWLNPAGAVPATVERVIKDTTNLFYGAEDK